MEKYIEIVFKRVVEDISSSNLYRLEFEDFDGNFRFPIIISSYDARPIQSILEINGEARPRTHELFARFITASGYTLEQVTIEKFERGIFSAVLHFKSDDKNIELDARPSDAVSLALRFKSRIFLAESVVEQLKNILNNNKSKALMLKRIKTLESKLEHLVKQELYEDAAKIRDEINKLKTSNQTAQ